MPKVSRFPITDRGTKICTVCLTEKPVSEYWAHYNKSGLQSQCKPCSYAQKLAYRRANQARYSAYYRERYAADPTSAREKNRAKYQANPEAGRGATAKWRRLHPALPEQMEQRRLRDRESYAADSTAKRKAARRFRFEHPELYIVYGHRRRARLSAGGHFTAREWLDLKTKYDRHCLMCRRQEPEIRLTVDHIVPISLGGSNHIDNIQPLCKSCNCKKHCGVLDFRPLEQAAFVLE